jgi:hypothetical protein
MAQRPRVIGGPLNDLNLFPDFRRQSCRVSRDQTHREIWRKYFGHNPASNPSIGGRNQDFHNRSCVMATGGSAKTNDDTRQTAEPNHGIAQCLPKLPCIIIVGPKANPIACPGRQRGMDCARPGPGHCTQRLVRHRSSHAPNVRAGPHRHYCFNRALLHIHCDLTR